ncbi:helix-turn-helix domain-containing protein [Thalassolituus oleivorans]|uniref:helix-turn-helix domain-containing protein n=1 Tax=Thalassolituus oleivorans TaxID=187493 RepID=UPI0023F120D4|nr:helix-turn-helix domain-containing protein [Thalassolituus oleivorans]
MAKYTKKELIIAHLIIVGHISSWQAFLAFRHTRLSALIYDLRQAGVSIRTAEERHAGGIHARYYVEDNVNNKTAILNALNPRMRSNVEYLMQTASDSLVSE